MKRIPSAVGEVSGAAAVEDGGVDREDRFGESWCGSEVWCPGQVADDVHGSLPYSFSREFIYKWVGHQDGGWDLQRVLPDPVFDCKAGNIPAEAKTICNM